MNQDKNSQKKIDKLNSDFWNELCGTGLAQHIGIKDNSAASLAKFDQAYLNIYPYLLNHIKPQKMKQKKVLEIGLGYGTLSQVIAEAGAEYFGLDIAANPVKMVNHRLNFLGLPENARQGNMLMCPFEDNFFDAVVSIGCFHHTGDLQRCLDETYRILKPGGRAIIMVYNKYSLRQWQQNFRSTLKSLLSFNRDQLNESERAAYDANRSGEAAPETILSSISDLKKMLRKFKKATFSKENSDPIRKIPREKLLNNVGKIAGLDIYFECIK